MNTVTPLGHQITVDATSSPGLSPGGLEPLDQEDANNMETDKLNSFSSAAGGQNISPLSRLSRPSSSCSVTQPGHLQVPFEKYSLRRLSAVTRLTSEVLSEEQAEAIRNCGALSTAVLGLMKSFSTTDLTSIESFAERDTRRSVSEIALFGGLPWNPKLDLPNIRQLDATSRSCSTWVAVGDQISCTSQLPSPQVPAGSVIGSNAPAITPLDFVLSVNKKVRQMYIRRRLLSTYRALERLSRSQLDITANTTSSQLPQQNATGDMTEQKGLVHARPPRSQGQVSGSDFLGENLNIVKSTSSSKLFEAWEKLKQDISTLTVRDIEMQKGKPLTKYERNMMIFNWLQDTSEDSKDQPFEQPSPLT